MSPTISRIRCNPADPIAMNKAKEVFDPQISTSNKKTTQASTRALTPPQETAIYQLAMKKAGYKESFNNSKLDVDSQGNVYAVWNHRGQKRTSYYSLIDSSQSLNDIVRVARREISGNP
jgi:hypothetical protein